MSLLEGLLGASGSRVLSQGFALVDQSFHEAGKGSGGSSTIKAAVPPATVSYFATTLY